jgi:acetyl esterase/lipase
MPPGVVTQQTRVPGPHGEIACRVYRPDSPTAVVLVWIHGGGFASGDLDMPESHVVASELAARSGAAVVSVGYRLAGNGVHFPVPLDDVCAAWRAVASGRMLGLHGDTLILGGASAGGALALSAAVRIRDEAWIAPAALLLAYPFAHYPNPAPEPVLGAMLAALPAVLRITPSSVESMIRAYVGRISDLPPGAMPGCGRLDGLPSVHIVVSEYDDLRPSSDLLLRQLADVGNDVSAYVARGMLHGHLNRTPSLREVDRSLAVFADVLRAHARRPAIPQRRDPVRLAEAAESPESEEATRGSLGDRRDLR